MISKRTLKGKLGKKILSAPSFYWTLTIKEMSQLAIFTKKPQAKVGKKNQDEG